MRPIVAALLALTFATGCTGTLPSAAPTGTPAPTTNSSPTPTASVTPRPTAAALRFPSAAEVDLAPGRYRSSPPFAVPFTFDILEAGWESGHLAPDFFDILQLAAPGRPTDWVAFALPKTIIGNDGPVDVDGLDPTAVAQLIAARDAVVATGPTRFDFAGLPATRLDLSTDVSGVKLFGGQNGDFVLDPTEQTRLVVAPLDEEILLVLVMAPRGGLEETWLKALPILGSVRFDE